MSKVTRPVRKGKSKVLGEPKIIHREEVEDMDLDSRVELIRSLIPLGVVPENIIRPKSTRWPSLFDDESAII